MLGVGGVALDGLVVMRRAEDAVLVLERWDTPLPPERHAPNSRITAVIPSCGLLLPRDPDQIKIEEYTGIEYAGLPVSLAARVHT